MRNPDPKGLSFESARPFKMAPMACSRIPKCRFRPEGLPAWKSPASAKVKRVLVDGERSAEPPSSHGKFGAMVFKTLADASRPAIPFASAGKKGISFDQFAGG